MEGLIGIVKKKKNGLVSKDSHLVIRGEKGTGMIDDYNNLIQEGRYYVRNVSESLNSPGCSFGILDVSKTYVNQIVQMFYGNNDSRPKYRHCTSTGVWQPWKEL